MKIISRAALGGQAWEENSRQRHVAARVGLREDHRLPRVAAASRSAPLPLARPNTCAGAGVADAYDISCITADFDTPRWTGEWRRLLAASQSPEKIYQTPEFFRFLADSHHGGSDQFELFAIRRRGTDNVVGMVPVRLSALTLDVKLGPATLGGLQRRIVRILGSVPIMPMDAALLHQLCAFLLQVFPDCAAVSMQSFPAEMQARLGGDRRHAAHLVHGWRACHTIPLPAAWSDFLAKLNAKKRYNLARQYRLLEQGAGPLQLMRVDRSADTRELVDAIAALAGPAGANNASTARDYRVLAANRLLLSYVLKSGTDVVAVIVGSRYGDTWHVHQIHYDQRYRHLSAGAVAMHCALQDVIGNFAFASADFGFGAPRYRSASTHVLKERAHVLVARKGSVASLLFGAFVRYDDAHAACVRILRPRLQRLLAR